MATGQASWPEHEHEAVGHQHPHYHLTHNFIERVGGFEHLGYQHTHEHSHAAESHSHYPHEDFATEHLGEAHEHEHEHASVGDGSTTANITKKLAKVESTQKKAAQRKRATPRIQQ